MHDCNEYMDNYIVNPDIETYRLNLMPPKKTQDGNQIKKTTGQHKRAANPSFWDQMDPSKTT